MKENILVQKTDITTHLTEIIKFKSLSQVRNQIGS